MKSSNVLSNYSTQILLFFSMVVLAVVLLIAPWDKTAENAQKDAQARFIKIAAWNDSTIETMFDQNSDALAAELNSLEPSN